MEDLYPEKNGCEKDSDINTDDDENPADVVLGGMPLRMTSGRTVQSVWTFGSFFRDLL